ncbi:MAG: hypothetical protein D3908_13920, partial [Candidatus Electrothrix sp. AUS4]|nr:hypothetical protein [Candidatus Electrothrix sp. AUS4]
MALVVQINGVRKEHCPSSAFLQKLGGKGRLAAVTTKGDLNMPPIALGCDRTQPPEH